MFEAVLFDLDRTLVDRDGAVERILADFDPTTREQLRALDDGGRGCRKRLFTAWEQLGGGPMDQASWGRCLAAELRPDPALLSRLSELSGRFRLGLISNGGGATQRAKLAATGLDTVFAEAVWISAEVGAAKPDVRLFESALQGLGVTPSGALYVGDLEEVDGVGARAAGLRFLQAEALWSASGWSRLLAEVAA